jgi:hypothetical protein
MWLYPITTTSAAAVVHDFLYKNMAFRSPPDALGSKYIVICAVTRYSPVFVGIMSLLFPQLIAPFVTTSPAANDQTTGWNEVLTCNSLTTLPYTYAFPASDSPPVALNTPVTAIPEDVTVATFVPPTWMSWPWSLFNTSFVVTQRIGVGHHGATRDRETQRE